MKKIGKIKKTGVAVTALSVSAALLATGLVCNAPYSSTASAAGSTATEVTVFEDLSVPTECTYGELFQISTAPAGSTVKVFAPNGADVTPAAATGDKYEIKALQIGNYNVKYYNDTDEKAAYEFTVNVSLDKEYELVVDHGGAKIPTRIKKGGTFKLPEASIVYYDENKILKEYPEESVTWTITDSAVDTDNPTGKTYNVGDTVTASKTGKLYINYSARIEADGYKYFNKTFTVNVQSEFSDKQAPSLTVSGISSNISVNRAVTMPKATVSDDYDENVYVDISVTDPDGKPVVVADVNEYGYAEVDKDKLAADDAELKKDEPDMTKINYPAVKFDNDEAMTFYPLKAGQYKVKYVAYDDEGNTSATKSWTMTAGDSVAPKFEEIAEWKIPDKWGLKVTNAEGDLASSTLEMPIPLLIDNKDHMPVVKAESAAAEDDKEEEDKDIISLYFRITDADYSRDIVTFKNILSKPAAADATDLADCQLKGNSVYGDEGTTYTFSSFSDTPFAFDFSKYHRKDKSGATVSDKSGKYTVYYRASDAAGNRSTKSFTIELESTFEDKNAPTIADITVPDYISTADATLNIPSVIAKDAETSSVHTVYRIYSDNDKEDVEGGRYITVDGGEKADIELRKEDSAENMYLVINKGKPYAKELKLKGNMYFCVTASDAAGNIASNAKEDIGGEYTVSNYTQSKDVVRIIDKSVAAGYSYTGNIAFKTATRDAAGKIDGWNESPTTITTKDTVNAGGFMIGIDDPDMRKYTGFEVSVKTSDGTPIETALETYTWYDEEATSTPKAKIYVNNITFRPSSAGDYYMTVRVFNVNNVNSAYSYKFTVEKSTSSGGTVIPSAVAAPEGNGEINVKYELEAPDDNYAAGESGKTYYHARKISCSGVYSLMGNEIVVKTQSSVSITDGFVESGKLDSYSNLGADFLTNGVNGGVHSFSVTDDLKPIIDIQGVMPTYSEKGTEAAPVKVVIPSIVAYTANGAADVKVEVTFDGKPVKVDTVEATATSGKTYSFNGTQDGEYTVTVTATRGSSSNTATYTVKVGDVIAPEFKIEGGTRGKKSQGSNFTFGKIKLVNTDEKNDVTITKKIYDPSGAEVSGATITGSYNSYADKEKNGSAIKLDKSGTYKVVYTARDTVGNEEPIIEYVTVSASGSSTPTTFTTLSTVLIIVAVVLLAGVIVYVVRFRKVKK